MIDLNPNVECIEKVGEAKKYKSDAHSPRGLVLGLIKKFINDSKKGKTYSPKELDLIFSEALRRINEIEEVGISRINSWKGKSGIIRLIKHPDKIIAIRMQKPDKKSKPKEIKIEMSKKEINAVIVSLNNLSEHQPIKTKYIAMMFSEILDLRHPDWDRFFADRHYHNLLTNILDVMDKENLISYVGGKTKILKNKLELQDILK